ncbi:hypothetical protein DYB26_008393 [Aphanomyces astaci]|uniref:ubiquitinyl hydrolase 1 n=1 Tax=Aphanomyces astaci TaxID=112090 RepID=A0A418FAF6_APHAT|nr:hypothetical protein DYB26_008393 [Aphanomyces astaci]
MAVNPTRILLLAHAGFVYLGGVFVYMGADALSSKYQGLSTGTILPASATFIVGAGFATILCGLSGAYVALRQTKANLLLLYTRALVLLCLLFLVSGVLGLVMHVQATSWSSNSSSNYISKFFLSSRVDYAKSFAKLVCPLALGYTCHSMEMTDPVEDRYAVQTFLMPSMPSVDWEVNSSGSNATWSGVNATVSAAVTMFPKSSGRFMDLCSNVTARVESLGPAKQLALELEAACDMCKYVAPVKQLPPWMGVVPRGNLYRPEDDMYLVVDSPDNYRCMQKLFPNVITRDPHSLLRDTTLVSTKFLLNWATYSLAIATWSGMSFVVTVLVAVDAHRSFKDTSPGQKVIPSGKLMLELLACIQRTLDRMKVTTVESARLSNTAAMPSAAALPSVEMETHVARTDAVMTGNSSACDASPSLSPLLFDVETHPTDAALANPSNFCFLNATLHCLFRSPHFLTSLHHLVNQARRNTPKTTCCASLLDAGIAMKDETRGECVDVVEMGLTAAMRACSSALIAPSPSRQVQQDAQECLSFLLDTLNEASPPAAAATSPMTSHLLQAIHLASSTDPATYAHLVTHFADVTWAAYSAQHTSFVARQFAAQVVRGSSCIVRPMSSFHRTLAINCGGSLLSLGLHSSTLRMSLESCLDQFRAMEVMDGLNQVWCAPCHAKTDHATQTLLMRTPPCLVLHLKRFMCDRGSVTKITAAVSFPVRRLNLSPVCFTRGVPDNNYRLYAVCAHVGTSLDRGHYVAYCRHTLTLHWLKYDDDCVSIVHEHTMLQQTLRSAYLLFYERFDVA